MIIIIVTAVETSNLTRFKINSAVFFFFHQLLNGYRHSPHSANSHAVQLLISAGTKPTLKGSAIAEAVSRRLPTAAARVRAQVRSCEISGGEGGIGADFL
jgi:hypothetical protein